VSATAKFCEECGTRLTDSETAEHRKIVSVLFTDVTGFTGLGERLDPETLRSIMARFFEAMRGPIERHGGRVEKFIGDAVMAVFGVPVVHEDDALRAVRAAVEMRIALDRLNVELEAEHGLRLRTRTGVNTGEVMAPGAGDTDRDFVIGDAVNVAARLEQAAPPGDILLGVTTHALVRDAVVAEPVAPLDLKGKAEPVPAFRLVSVTPDAAGRQRHLDAPMVGRARQLRALEDALAAAVEDSSTFLATVVGPAGVGKTRLVEEFLREADHATIHRGRCLSYGEGITFWPVDQIVRSIVGVDEVARGPALVTGILETLAGDPDAAEVATKLAGILGAATDPVSREDGFWAIRTFLERAATERPLVAVFDDIHWAEPMLLDLIDHIADWSRRAPILLLCTARPELLDGRPTWGGGKANAASTLLQPLSVEESSALIENLLGSGVAPEVVELVSGAAGGNPLFVEEMVAELIDDGRITRSGSGWHTVDRLEVSVPASIQSLISARLDRLEPSERAVLERGAVEGDLFHLGSVEALAPDLSRAADIALALVRKELVRPDRSEFAGDAAFRFRHTLIRDVAYSSIPKHARAVLHERFGRSLLDRAGDGAGLGAIVAHHFDQAFRLLDDVGGDGERRLALAREAGMRSHEAGAVAERTGDIAAAIRLFERAASLLPGIDAFETRLHLGRTLHRAGSFDRARDELVRLETDANEAGRRRVALLAGAGLLEVADSTAEEIGVEEMLGRSKAIARELRSLGDEVGAARALIAVINWRDREDGVIVARRAVETAVLHGDAGLEAEAEMWVTLHMHWGFAPASEGFAHTRAWLARGIPDRWVEARAWAVLGGFHGFLGQYEEGRAALDRARALGDSVGDETVGVFHGLFLELLAGDLDRAAEWTRLGFERYRGLGEKSRMSTLAAMLAELSARRGDDAEADRYIGIAAAAANPGDEDTFAVIAAARAITALRTGHPASAIESITEAIRLNRSRGDWNSCRYALVLSDALVASGDTATARSVLDEALVLATTKEIVAVADGIRERLDRLV
jgi:class 3 adenylate cyclase/tetratricopeptide (TPR) repeat protein